MAIILKINNSTRNNIIALKFLTLFYKQLTKIHSMKSLSILILTILTLWNPLFSQEPSNSQPGMNNTIMERILKGKVELLEGVPGNWQLIYKERLVFILTDETNNRMRIFTPFIEIDSLQSGEAELLLAANFHSALDSKYCFFDGLVISVYTHPLRELTQPQFEDALLQVVTLANTFRGSYSSTELIFTPGLEKPKEPTEEEIEKEKRLNKKPGKGKS